MNLHILWWKIKNLPHLLRGVPDMIMGLVRPVGRLYVEVHRADGRTERLGLVSTRVVTTAGVNYLVDAFQGTTEPENFKYHAMGTGNTAESSGDTALVTEVEVAVVKEGLAEQAGGLSVLPALSLSPQKAQAVIRTAASRAMTKIGSILPYRLEPPFRLRAQFTAERFAERRAGQPNVRRLDAVTVEMERADHPWLLL